tara:strand:+ start:308 stop:607 length:300 start_codon:yes stop_codon:yes gene_type:complete
MASEPFDAALLEQGGALLDAPAIGNHHRCHQAAVFCPPPAWRPVAAALFLEGTVAEKGHQPFAGQGHVHVFQLGKAEIASLVETAGGVDIDVAAQGGGG